MFFADDTCKVRTTITLHPSRFLQLCGVRFGLKIALSKSPGTIEHALRAYTAVPDNAIIFKLCWEGRTEAINLLFEKGLASPWDTDSYGETPLMIVALAGRLDTCKFLMRKGADVEARNIVAMVLDLMLLCLGKHLAGPSMAAVFSILQKLPQSRAKSS
ncbi:hypothetical protein EAF04_008715 [Stromatinia cepivora]|nr:hypothetical protein EAF04_008715 [Stromatinia cepivora]